MRHVPIHRDQRLKPRPIRGVQKRAVSKASETRVSARLAVVTEQVVAKPLVYALVQEEAHLTAGKQGFSRFFHSPQGLLPADRRESL